LRSPAPHVIQRLYQAEDLVRRRRADEHRRHAAAQRAARIDPNPHQIDAVVFALARLSDGGCILADEVGLGKTIEAGLVIAQLLAEGARRILVVTPKALLGQWKQELFALFAIDAREVTRGEDAFRGDNVFLATRDLVGSEAGVALLQAAERFDLCVIDEAHEVFAGIYKRFDSHGSLRDDSRYARMAVRLSGALRDAGTPVLLLTATPIQNSLLELWGLVHYVDPTGTLLGDLPTFRSLFCPLDDRVLAEGQEHELQRRLATVLQRTLRRQAQEFMREPFMARQARLFDYPMSQEERALYDDITTYLLEPSLYAFRGNQRKLLLLGFHRRMASSLAALSASLEKVAERLRRLRDRHTPDDDADRAAMLDDLEDDDDEDGADDATPPPSGDDQARISTELARVEGFIARARALPTDSKARVLLRAVKLVIEQGELDKTSGKLVIFTESLTTQGYLRSLLIESHLVTDDDITLFRGTNDLPRHRHALARWDEEVGCKLPAGSRPSPDVAIRLALVHEFRVRSRILISTEAGAKGLNLQFCDTVVNYDLPWNPQRIEQRIGRCHRYAQHRDVTVINFLAQDNEAQRLTFEILSQKLDLFGLVLGATDEVLHRPGAIAAESLASAMGNDFETQLRRIYERARTIDEVERDLRELRDSMDTKRREFETAQKRTEEVIQRRFDSTVQQAFHRIQAELPRELAEFDQHIERVVIDYLEATQIPYKLERRGESTEVTVGASSRLPASLCEGTACLVGNTVPGSPLPSLHLGHPLVQAALEAARAATRDRTFTLRIAVQAPEAQQLKGHRGRLRLVRILYRGFEPVERLLPVVVLDGFDEPLSTEVARHLLEGTITDLAALSAPSSSTEAVLDDALEELMFHQTGEAGTLEQPRFERTLEQIERFMTDRVLLLSQQRDLALVRLARAEAARDAAMGPEQRDRAEAALRRVQSEIDRLDSEVSRLRAGDDDNYERWRQNTHERRYATPEIERLLDAEIEIA
jgi:adenine-specific DNA-methyltransferase